MITPAQIQLPLVPASVRPGKRKERRKEVDVKTIDLDDFTKTKI